MGVTAALIGIAGASAIAPVVGGLISKKGSDNAAKQSYEGQQSANAANIQIAREYNDTNIAMTRETNAANLALAEKQNQWNIEQWNRQNEYNSPANQMALYKEAGLNPVLAQGNFSPAQELQSAPLANQVAPQANHLPNVINPAAESSQIKMQGAQSFGQSVSNAIRSSSDVYKALNEARKTAVETGIIPKMSEAQIGNLLSDSAFKKIQGGAIKDLTAKQIEEIQSKIQVAGASIEVMKADKHLKTSQAELVKWKSELDSVNFEILQAQKQALKEIPNAQKHALFASAFQAMQSGHLEEWQYKFMLKHGYSSTDFANLQMFNTGQKNQIQMFNAGQKNAYKIASERNLTDLQVSGIMAGSSTFNNLINVFGPKFNNQKNFNNFMMNWTGNSSMKPGYFIMY